jgi:hypothetical protein
LVAATAIASAQSGTLSVTATEAAPGQQLLFTVSFTPTFAAPFGTLDFGDGSSAPVTKGVQMVAHAYAAPGFYVATLRAAGGVLASIGIRIVAPARVPAGAIYTVTPTLSPVLAGSNIALVVTYAVASVADDLPSAPQLEFVVDLLDANGALLRRSDPFILSPGIASGTQIARIPYAVPVDASGIYGVRVYARVVSGGTVAVAPAIALPIIGGPDPAPIAKTAFHAKGSIEIGPQAGSAGTPGAAAALNAGATTALAWNEASVALSGLYDPVSRRSDPLLTYESGSAPNVQSPDESTAGGSTGAFALSHGGVSIDAGRTQSSLPQILGGGDQIRGIDAVAQDGILTFHSGYGYTQLPGQGVPEEYASAFDAGAALPDSGLVRLTDFNSGGPAGNTRALALQYTQQPVKDLTVLATGAITPSDSADQFQLTYASAGTNASVLYDDAGPDMTVGGGPGALSDRASFAAQWQSQLSRVVGLSAGWNSNESRSEFSRSTDGFATLTINSPALPTFTLTLRRDDQAAIGMASTDDQVNFGITKSVQSWNASFNGSLSGLRAILGSTSGTTRTGSVQLMHQMGPSSLSAGVNATAVSGATGSSQVGETVEYGFPFLCVPSRCLLQMQVEGDDSNTRAFNSGGVDRTASAILSYHVASFASLGLRAEIRRHDDVHAALSGTASAVRLRLDLDL